MPASSRTVFAAAHVVADPLADRRTGAPALLDWDATLAFRHHLWSLGLGVADAMDTAQRGMGLDWAATKELIERSGTEARSVGGLLCCGVGTDQLTTAPDAAPSSLSAIGDAYEDQLDVVEGVGAQPVIMCSRALAATARSAEDYAAVYDRLLARAQQPVILHWLGDMFDPALRGYWGSADLDEATDAVLGIIRTHTAKIDGIKVSLLEADREVALRRALPEGVRLYTGDDFNFPELIAGDEHGFSHALLGVFDPLAVQAAEALSRLDQGDVPGFRAVLDPLVPLARHIFAAPTQFYKTGVVFLAYLSGHQEHFRMVGGLESARDAAHLRQLFALADEGRIFPDPECARRRFASLGIAAACDLEPVDLSGIGGNGEIKKSEGTDR